MREKDTVEQTMLAMHWSSARVMREAYGVEYQNTPEAAEAIRAHELWEHEGVIVPTVRAFCEERLKASEEAT